MLYSRKYRAIKALKDKEMAMNLAEISVGKASAKNNIEALQGIDKIYEYQEKQAKENRKEKERLQKLECELKDEKNEFELEKR